MRYDWNFGDGQSASVSGPTVSHTFVAGGSYTATVTVIDTNNEYASASVTQEVVIDRISPTITVSVMPQPNAAGWNNTDVTAAFACTDAETGISNCTESIITTAEKANQVITGTATDNAGNSTTVDITVNIDKTAAIMIGAITPAPNAAGWNNTDTTVSFTCSDGLSGVASCPMPVEVTTEGANQTISRTAYDLAENAATVTTALNIDKTAPTIIATITPEPNVAGWNKSDVTISFTCSDTLAGIAVCPPPVVVSTESAGQLITGTAIDWAGNTATATVTVNLDKTEPVIAICGVQNGGEYTHGSVPAPCYAANDAVSGVVVSEAAVSGGDGLGLGTFTYLVTVLDNAGNTATATAVYTVIATVSGTSTVIDQLTTSGEINDSGTANSLIQELANAQAAYANGNDQQGDNVMQAFINHIQAQAGVRISAEATAELINAANYIITH